MILLIISTMCMVICVNTKPQQNTGYNFNQNAFNRPQTQNYNQQTQQNYNQPIQQQQQQQQQQQFNQQPVRNFVPITSYQNDVNYDGSYTYSYISGDGSQQQARGFTRRFRAECAHLPTPPPIPEAIAKALQYIRSVQPQPIGFNQNQFNQQQPQQQQQQQQQGGAFNKYG